MPPANPHPKRCAIYTRKSSEEGLEQDFNSLHAQRESCESFIKSQRAEGWQLVTTAYDDGGFSGGCMNRPALQHLLEDIRHKRIDIIVVYKIDRLTRSLADFAKMVEVFDGAGVSFVAVTQQFNTTSSMGRLTLNILLSFAQFEREVTAERIRDKIAASKKKGLWMGGVVPLGYEVKDRKLIVKEAEAETVRHIYRRYLELGCVRALKVELEQRGIRSKPRIGRDGSDHGSNPLGRGALYTLLSNPLYRGDIRHGTLRYPGLHEAIIDVELWDKVQVQLAGNGPGRGARPPVKESSPLAGKLFDDAGERLTPSHAVKKGRRYRYYISQSLTTGTAVEGQRRWRLPAPDLERAVASVSRSILMDREDLSVILRGVAVDITQIPSCLARAAALAARLDDHDTLGSVLTTLVRRVEIAENVISVSVSLAALLSPDTPSINGLTPVGSETPALIRTVPMTLRKRGVEMRLIIDSHAPSSRADPTLIKAIARGRSWWHDLTTGAQPSIAAIARREGVSDGYISHLLPLAFLAPSIIEAILAGNHPPDVTTESLTKRTDLPLAWEDQRTLLGFA